MAKLTLSSAFQSKYDLLAENLGFPANLQNIKVRRPPSKNLTRLTSITLDHEGIDKLDSVSCLTECCPRLEDLDLSHNSITSWNEVLLVLLTLPRLKLLNVSFNPLEGGDILCPTHSLSGSTCSLKTLILNGTSCSWSCVSQFLQHLPNLEELHLSCNQLEGPPSELHAHTTVKRLHLNNNNLGEWSDYEAVSRAFPQLEVLVARCNPLSSVDVSHSEGDADNVFSNLTSLNLSGTALLNPGDFFSVIGCYSSLCNLRLQEVPLLDAWPNDLQRSFVIACTPSISCLNGSSVSDNERDCAERAFLRFFTEEAVPPAWLQQRYDEMLKKHGAPQPLAKVDLAPPTHVALTVRWEPENKAVQLQLPLDAKPREVARLVAEEFGLDTASAPRFRLLLVDVVAVAMDQYGIAELRFEKPLYSYHAHDGDELLVSWR